MNEEEKRDQEWLEFMNNVIVNELNARLEKLPNDLLRYELLSKINYCFYCGAYTGDERCYCRDDDW